MTPPVVVALLIALQLQASGGATGGGRRGAPTPPATRNTWLGADKVTHFFSSFFVQSVSYSVFRVAGANSRASLAGATAVSAAVGVAKEVHDRRS